MDHVQTSFFLLAQDFATFARVSGYVEQFDIHSPQATVKEALWFSARLRLTNDISNKELWAFIRQVRRPGLAKPWADKLRLTFAATNVLHPKGIKESIPATPLTSPCAQF